jgi:hypothetical protein
MGENLLITEAAFNAPKCMLNVPEVGFNYTE